MPPIKIQELNKISQAIVETIRSYIPYSGNIDFFGDVEEINNYLEYAKQVLPDNKDILSVDEEIKRTAISSLLSGIGDCTELSKVACTLLKHYNHEILSNYNFQLARCDTWYHYFVVLYPENQKNHINDIIAKELPYERFIEELKNKDIVILDPWVCFGAIVDEKFFNDFSFKMDQVNDNFDFSKKIKPFSEPIEYKVGDESNEISGQYNINYFKPLIDNINEKISDNISELNFTPEFNNLYNIDNLRDSIFVNEYRNEFENSYGVSNAKWYDDHKDTISNDKLVALINLLLERYSSKDNRTFSSLEKWKRLYTDATFNFPKFIQNKNLGIMLRCIEEGKPLREDNLRDFAKLLGNGYDANSIRKLIDDTKSLTVEDIVNYPKKLNDKKPTWYNVTTSSYLNRLNIEKVGNFEFYTTIKSLKDISTEKSLTKNEFENIAFNASEAESATKHQKDALQYIMSRSSEDQVNNLLGLIRDNNIQSLDELDSKREALIKETNSDEVFRKYGIDQSPIKWSQNIANFKKISELNKLSKETQNHNLKLLIAATQSNLNDSNLCVNIQKIESSFQYINSECDKILQSGTLSQTQKLAVNSHKENLFNATVKFVANSLFDSSNVTQYKYQYMKTIKESEASCRNKIDDTVGRKILSGLTNFLTHLTLVGMVANVINKYKTGNWLLFKHNEESRKLKEVDTNITSGNFDPNL